MPDERMMRPPLAMSDVDTERNLRGLLVIVCLATVVGGAVDLILDAPDNWLSAHVIFELSLIVAAVLVMGGLWRGWVGSRRNLVATHRLLEHHVLERDQWRASAESLLAGLGRAIDERFIAWELTPTERQIALLLLKGRSYKQIAFETGRSERTVRQHAVTVYHKSALQGRAELSAFFLEDLLLPNHAETRAIS